MSFDNRIFNVNGEDFDTLKKAIELVFMINSEHTKAVSWEFHKDKGLIFSWTKTDRGHLFPIPLDSEKAASITWDWLKTEDSKNMKCEDWDCDNDHDGSNGDGWRVYVEDWGHVGTNSYAICAIRPVYVWYGK